VLWLGTSGLYLCINKMKQKHLKHKAMNTNITLSNLSSMFTSEDSYRTLVDMINEMDLELMDIRLV
jgi:MinD-like ATPase involved in chromosome partitioning or flagellar assembly